jgi:hypothetical protein
MQAFWIKEAKPQAFLCFALDKGSAQLHVQTTTSGEGGSKYPFDKGLCQPQMGVRILWRKENFQMLSLIKPLIFKSMSQSLYLLNCDVKCGMFLKNYVFNM